MRAAALLLLVPACDVVFGLDRSPSDAAIDQAVIDADGETVTGQFTLRYAANQADGSPMVVEEAHPDVALQVFVEGDHEGISPVLDDDGRFTFQRPPGSRYRLIWSSALDRTVPIEWQTDAASPVLATFAAARPTRRLVTQPTLIGFPTPPAAGEHIVYSTGIWSESVLTGDSMNWQTAGVHTPPVGLLEADRFDRLYYAVRQPFVDAAAGQTYYAFGMEASAQVTMVDGMPAMVPLTFAPSSRDQCARVVALRSAMMARVALAAPGSAFVLADWIIQATPSMELGAVGAMTLAYNSETAAATNATLTAMYRNPFPGHLPIGTMGGAHRRYITAAGAQTPLELLTGVRVYTPVSPCPTMTVLDSTQGIPGTIRIADTPLTTDGVVVVVPANQRVPLTWNLAVDGRVDLTAVTIFEVVADAGKTALVPVRSYRTVDQGISLDVGHLQATHQYIVRLDSNIGHVGARTGDLRTVAYPYGTATQWSRVFGVNVQ